MEWVISDVLARNSPGRKRAGVKALASKRGFLQELINSKNTLDVPMIYLAEHKLLFFKPKKTAGTSVEIALSCNASARDIVTPIHPLDEIKRHELGGQLPVNWAWSAQSEENYRSRFEDYLRTGTLKPRWFGFRRGKLYKRREAKWVNHITPAKVAKSPEGRAMMEGAFIVTMCRHPYETMVSYASHLHAENGGSLERVLDWASKQAPFNEKFLFGERRPDFVIRYEHLKEDLAQLEQKFGLVLCSKLPVTKGTARKDRRSAHEVLTPVQKERIRKSHARSFEGFGYES